MAASWTNRGKLRAMQAFLQNRAITGFNIAFITDTNVPTEDTKVFSELEEIATGNGYSTGGIPVARNAVNFAGTFEDDVNDLAAVGMALVSIVATGGTIPSSGDGISYLVFLDNDPVIADREVYGFAQFSGTEKIVPDTGILSVNNLIFTLTEPA